MRGEETVQATASPPGGSSKGRLKESVSALVFLTNRKEQKHETVDLQGFQGFTRGGVLLRKEGSTGKLLSGKISGRRSEAV